MELVGCISYFDSAQYEATLSPHTEWSRSMDGDE